MIQYILFAALRAIKLLASVLSSPSNKDIAMMQLLEWLGDSSANANSTLRFVAAILYMFDDNLKEAIKIMGPPTNMEQ